MTDKMPEVEVEEDIDLDQQIQGYNYMFSRHAKTTNLCLSIVAFIVTLWGISFTRFVIGEENHWLVYLVGGVGSVIFGLLLWRWRINAAAFRKERDNIIGPAPLSVETGTVIAEAVEAFTVGKNYSLTFARTLLSQIALVVSILLLPTPNGDFDLNHPGFLISALVISSAIIVVLVLSPITNLIRKKELGRLSAAIKK